MFEQIYRSLLLAFSYKWISCKNCKTVGDFYIFTAVTSTHRTGYARKRIMIKCCLCHSVYDSISVHVKK